jgi:hypothetical protein
VSTDAYHQQLKGKVMTRSLEWGLAALIKNPEVSRALVARTSKLPTYSKTMALPKISSCWGTADALAFARESVSNAVTVATSPAMSSETLSQLARFPQKTVRKRLIENPSLDRETVEFLYDWLVSEGETVLSKNIFSKQHPAKWWSLFRIAFPKLTQSEAFDRVQSLAASYVKSLGSLQARTYYAELQDLFGPLISEEEFRVLAVTTGQLLLPSRGSIYGRNALVTFNAFFEGIEPVRERVLVIGRAMSLVCSGVPLSASLLDDLVNECDVLTQCALPTTDVVLNDSQVLSFLDRGSPWLERLASVSCAGSTAPSDEVINALAQRDPVGFVKANGFENNHKRLSVESVEAVLCEETRDVFTWTRGRVAENVAKRLPFVNAELSAVLALRMPPDALVDLLNTGVAPSCSPAQIIDLLSGDVHCLNDRGVYTTAPGHPVWVSPRYQVRGRYRQALASVMVALMGESPMLATDTAGARWMLELIDLASGATSHSALFGYSEQHRDLYVYAVYYWLNKHLGDSPTGWLAALDLLPKWSGTVQELAVTVKESLQ